MTTGKYHIVYIYATFIFLCSCGTDADQMSPEEKYTVDTLFSNQLNNYRRQLDSICSADKDTLFVQTVDSLKKEGMKEIEMLLMKNHRAE